MGTDKAALSFDGVTLLGRAARAGAEAGADAVLVVGRASRPDGWDGPESALFVPDPPGRAGQGPLAGIVTALEEAAGRHHCAAVIAVACDMPWLSADALRWLRDADAKAPEDAHGTAVVGKGGGPEPLFALYRAACLPLLRGCLEAGELSPRRCLARGRFAHTPVPARLLPVLEDVDTPDDLDRARGRKTASVLQPET